METFKKINIKGKDYGLDFVEGRNITITDLGNGYQIDNTRDYISGDVVCTSTNVNPSTMLGGEWELIDKELKNIKYKNDDIIDVNYDNCTLVDATAYTAGHNIHISLYFRILKEIKDETINFGKLKLNNLGISKLAFQINTIFLSDGGNSIAFMEIPSSGEINSSDVISRNTVNDTIKTTYVDNGKTNKTNIYGEINSIVVSDHMLDEFCGKFFWKKL